MTNMMKSLLLATTCSLLMAVPDANAMQMFGNKPESDKKIQLKPVKKKSDKKESEVLLLEDAKRDDEKKDDQASLNMGSDGEEPAAMAETKAEDSKRPSVFDLPDEDDDFFNSPSTGDKKNDSGPLFPGEDLSDEKVFGIKNSPMENPRMSALANLNPEQRRAMMSGGKLNLPDLGSEPVVNPDRLQKEESQPGSMALVPHKGNRAGGDMPPRLSQDQLRDLAFGGKSKLPNLGGDQVRKGGMGAEPVSDRKLLMDKPSSQEQGIVPYQGGNNQRGIVPSENNNPLVEKRRALEQRLAQMREYRKGVSEGLGSQLEQYRAAAQETGEKYGELSALEENLAQNAVIVPQQCSIVLGSATEQLREKLIPSLEKAIELGQKATITMDQAKMMIMVFNASSNRHNTELTKVVGILEENIGEDDEVFKVTAKTGATMLKYLNEFKDKC